MISRTLYNGGEKLKHGKIDSSVGRYYSHFVGNNHSIFYLFLFTGRFSFERYFSRDSNWLNNWCYFFSCFTSISYFAFLHKIPEKTYEKIEKLLNDRLGYETTNHNAVMGALNPNNEVLLNLVSKDHRELKVLTGETLQHLRMEKAAKENREHILTNAEKEIDKHIESLRAFSDIMVKQQERIVHLEKENMELKEQIQNLNAQLNQQHEQSQYHKHENEQDFGMYL